MILAGGDSFKPTRSSEKPHGRTQSRKLCGGRGERGVHEAKTGRREQEGQVKKDEVSTNRKQPYGLFTS